MDKIFEIYLYICGIIVSICVLAGLTVLMLNLIGYFYQTTVGFDTFKKFLRKYNKEMQEEKQRKRKQKEN